MVWETLAKKKNVDYKKLSIVFSAVQIHEVVKAPLSGKLTKFQSSLSVHV